MSTYSHTRAVQIAKSRRISYLFNLRDSILGRHFSNASRKVVTFSTPVHPVNAFATYLSVNLLSTFWTQCQLSALFGINWCVISQEACLKFCMCIIGPKSICEAWILLGKASVISEFREPAWDVICLLKCTWPVQTSRFPPMVFNIASQWLQSNRKQDDTVEGFTIAVTRDECHTHLSCRWPADLCCCLF